MARNPADIYRFIESVKNLVRNKDITIDEVYKFAEQEFGQVSDILKLQINKIFKGGDAPSIKNPEKADVLEMPKEETLESSMKGLSSLIDEIKGITPEARNTMDRNEMATFIRKMRGKGFTRDQVGEARKYADEMSLTSARETKAPSILYANNLGAKTKEEFALVDELLENVNDTSPSAFKETYADISSVNLNLTRAMDQGIENSVKRKYNWDDSQLDGGLDDPTYEAYENELYDKQGTISRMTQGLDKEPYANHPNNWLDKAGEYYEQATGEPLNVNFYKNYVDDIMGRYMEQKDFAKGGRVNFRSGTKFRKIPAAAKEGLESLKDAIGKVKTKFGDKFITTADKAPQPEKSVEQMAFEFNQRNKKPDAISMDSREILDVPPVPEGFKLSKEKLLENFPEIDADMADQIMELDKDTQGRVIMMLRNRRQDPEAYDKLLETKGDTLEFQGEFDKVTRRKNNNRGGLNYLMGL